LSAFLTKLGLGSAQFGLDGGNPTRGRPVEQEAREILTIAARSGLTWLDATAATGHAETVLGRVLPRPLPFRMTVKAIRADKGVDLVEAEARASLQRLGAPWCEAIVIQTPSDLFGPHGPALWACLRRLQAEGLFRQVGISCYASDDPAGLAQRFKPDFIQAPASLLDQRLLADGTLARIRAMGVGVHLRSIFLNGLLFLPPDRVPAQLKGASGRLSRARRMIAEGRSDPLQAALGFALSRPEADVVLVGVTTAAELSAVVAAAAHPPPDLDWDEMAIDDPVLDHDRWAAA
jgi:aryl-alcohol dehydrogenase-like predicted oxidoreductase